MTSGFNRLAVVNRGEAAMRLLNAVAEYVVQHDVDLRTIALYTEPDASAWFVRAADETHLLGPAMSEDPAGGQRHTYLDEEALERALVATRADAVWVGWGFVAESASFAARCERLGVTWIGPSSDVIRSLGDKIAAKRLAERAGVSVLPWSGGPVDAESAPAVADELGYPVLVKASAGGGGRGIRLVERAEDLAAAVRSASGEAASAFGDPAVFLETPVTAARHVEVQVVADHHGTAWALGVRDCSVQRRNQKVVEESHSTALDATEEKALREAAIAIAQEAGYTNAGTVEFLYDPDAGSHYFLEVNTRLQVEHPVTELVTGTDIVKLQLHVASGGRLEGEPPPPQGHAIEVRLNAEDPTRDFTPTPGTVRAFRVDAGPGIRVDTGVAEGDAIAPQFDSMVAKVLAWGADRGEAIARLDRALSRSIVHVDGGTTNKGALLAILRHPDFRAGRIGTRWLDGLVADRSLLPAADPLALVVAAIDAYRVEHTAIEAHFHATAARGRPELRSEDGQRIDLRYAGAAYRLHVYQVGATTFRVHEGEDWCDVDVERLSPLVERVRVGGGEHRVVSVDHGVEQYVEIDGVVHRLERDDGGAVRAPSPAVVIAVLAEEGASVRAGDPVVIVESMKMETTIRAAMHGRVREIAVRANTQVEAGAPLMFLEPDEVGAEVAGGDRIALAALCGRVGDADVDPTRSVMETLRTRVLGYEFAAGVRGRLGAALDELIATADGGDVELLTREIAVMEVVVDLCGLSARRPPQDRQEGVVRAPAEDLLVFLRSMDRGPDVLPEPFVERLARALARYGVDTLDRSPALESALVWLYRALAGLDDLVPYAVTICERWRQAGPALPAAAVASLRPLLDALVRTSQERYPVLADLARQVRFAVFEQPVLEAARRELRAEMEGLLAALARDPGTTEREAWIDRLVACPMPLRTVLAEWYHAFDEPDFRSIVLEVRLRRSYRPRLVGPVGFTRTDDVCIASADHERPGRRVHVALAYADVGALDRLAEPLQAHLADAPDDRRVVVDLTLRWPDLPADDDEVAEAVRSAVTDLDPGPDVHRVDCTVWLPEPAPDAGRVVHVTFRPVQGRRRRRTQWREDPLYRNLHPMVGKRLALWRLSNFDLERIDSVEDVILFHAVAKDNPDDERLFALAEVRDLTPIVDAEGRVLSLPLFERTLMEALASIRNVQAQRGADQRLLWNRVVLHVPPVWEFGAEDLRRVAHRLAPATEGLALQKVVVQGHIRAAATGDVEEAVVHVENPGMRGVVVRVTGPPEAPIKPLSAYRQKVLRTRRRGGVYPFEIVKLMTPPAGTTSDFPTGTFTELDLANEDSLRAMARRATGERPDDALVPVSRPYGENTANLIVGRIVNHTAKHPEGMARILIAGDPSKSLGSVAEPECRRILAALDLAERERIPVEWFTLSSGARIAMDSGTENMDWVARVLRRIVEFTQAGGEINVVVAGINVGAQPYWNAEATMLMHCSGILVMTPQSAMVLTGKQALDFSGGVSAEDNLGIGGYERVMGPNGQAQYWAPDIAGACELLLRHYEFAYVAPGERFPRRARTEDARDRDIRSAPHSPVEGSDFETVGAVLSAERNAERKLPFDIRSVMRAVSDTDAAPLERWARLRNAENAVVWESHLGGIPVTLLGVESHVLPRQGFHPADGPAAWTAGTLFPQSSRKIARAINAASGSRPLVVLANLSGFDGSPESMRMLQLEYGAEIGRAIVNFDGPIVFTVISRYHGGAFVVFSRALNDHLEVAAVEGAKASVIGGAPAAAVVFARQVLARVERDARVASLRQRLVTTASDVASSVRAQLDRVRGEVHGEKLGEVADEFDAIHDIDRARQVGSVDRIVPAGELRPYLIDALERGMEAVRGT